MEKFSLKHKLTYLCGDFTAEDLNDHCGSDAVVVFSIKRSDQESFQTEFSIDGETGNPITDEELWKVWITLAKKLGSSSALGDEYRALSENTWEIFNEYLDHDHCHNEVINESGVTH